MVRSWFSWTTVYSHDVFSTNLSSSITWLVSNVQPRTFLFAYQGFYLWILFYHESLANLSQKQDILFQNYYYMKLSSRQNINSLWFLWHHLWCVNRNSHSSIRILTINSDVFSINEPSTEHIFRCFGNIFWHSRPIACMHRFVIIITFPLVAIRVAVLVLVRGLDSARRDGIDSYTIVLQTYRHCCCKPEQSSFGNVSTCIPEIIDAYLWSPHILLGLDRRQGHESCLYSKYMVQPHRR